MVNNKTARFQNRRFKNESSQRPRTSCYKAKQSRYSRKTDCWNCGMGGHRKEHCPQPHRLCCSYCQKKNIRSDECSCRESFKERPKRKIQKLPQKPKPSHKRIETAIFVTIYGKTVRALINPSVQETNIGPDVANFIKVTTGNMLRNVVLRRAGSIGLVSCIQMALRTKARKEIKIDGMVNPKLKEKVIVLGMEAISLLGFKFSVGGQQAKTRILKNRPNAEKPKRKPKENSAQDNNSRQEDDEEDDLDQISFLDEKEAEMIREWM